MKDEAKEKAVRNYNIVVRTLSYYVFVIVVLIAVFDELDKIHTQIFTLILFIITFYLFLRLIYDWLNLNTKKDTD